MEIACSQVLNKVAHFKSVNEFYKELKRVTRGKPNHIFYNQGYVMAAMLRKNSNIPLEEREELLVKFRPEGCINKIEEEVL